MVAHFRLGDREGGHEGRDGRGWDSSLGLLLQM